MNDICKTSKGQMRGRASAQNLVHGLFGRRLAARSNAELDKAELTGKAA